MPSPAWHETFGGKYVVVANGCWEWCNHRDRNGYAMLYAGKRSSGVSRYIVASRRSWEIENETIAPKELVVMHSCDNPPCIYPPHLSLGTKADNSLDMVNKGRSVGISDNWQKAKTVCPQGHPYDVANTGMMAGGTARRCKTCHRERERLSRRWEEIHA